MSSGGSATSISCTFGSSVTGGNLIVVSIGSYNRSPNGSVLWTVEDNKNSTDYTVGPSANLSQYPAEVAIFWYVATLGGSGFDVTATTTGDGQYAAMTIDEFSFTSGATISADGTQTNSGTSGSGTFTASSITPTGTDLIVAAFSGDGASGTCTAGSGFTMSGNQGWNGGSNDSCSLEYALNVSTSQSIAIGFAGSPSDWGFVALALKATGGAAGNGPPYWYPHSILKPRQRPPLSGAQFTALYG